MTIRHRDEGSALILVIGAMATMTVIVSVALTYALQTSGRAQQSDAWNQALAAAEAGVDDYLARLNQNDGYWTTVDCTNRALEGATTRTNACGWNASTTPGWLDVPGAERAEFHYDVDVVSTPVDGTIDLVSTGRVGDVTRSIQVTLRRGGFGEFLYYTTYETKDPADMADPVTAYTRCAKYYWAGRSTSYCGNITFVGEDKADGPVHSNDTMLMSDGTTAPNIGKGPWFQGTVTTSVPACKPVNGNPQPYNKCYRWTSTTHPRFDKGIAYRSEVEIPDSIGDLRQYVDPTKTNPAGCLYTGPTRIQFLAPVGNATPQMKVWSPWSKSALNAGCGNASVAWPQTVNVPQNNLIMVQDVPATQTTPASGPCADASVGGFPDSDDYGQRSAEANCRYGTVFVSGTLKGRVTISADNNVVIVGNLSYHGGDNGTDALGLIAENSVQVYHPIETVCTRTVRQNRKDVCVEWGPGDSNLAGSLSNPEIDASILTLQHSFEVQSYDVGAKLGTLHVYGSIAQRFRGIVGQSTHGYYKDYRYDSRLRYAPPPYFLDPVRSAWGQKTFGEVAPRYGD